MGACFSCSTDKVTEFGSRDAASAVKEKPRVGQSVNGKRRKGRGRQQPCGKGTDFGFDRNFGSRYAIGRLLGHGQFGYTFFAIDRVNGDRVAVKRIERNKDYNHANYECLKKEMVLPIAVEDVKREIKILEVLRGHENVVHFYNAFEDDKYVYIVMEKDNRYSEKDAAVVVRQMLQVAAECHLHGLVHRDMKPENFLFKSTQEDSPLKATDFGLSEFITPGKRFHDIAGSAYYVAPEVLKRKSGPESDVWSIGVITYVLLSGRRPFWDRSEDGIFKELSPCMISSIYVKYWPTVNPRLTNAFLAAHTWVKEGGVASEIPLDISVLSNMRQFVKFSRFKQFALRVKGISTLWNALASTLNEFELAGLRDQFDAMDVDKNGAISLEEMRQALAKDLPWKMMEPRVLEILEASSEHDVCFREQIDSNTDGLVDFSEFVAAALHVHQLEDDSEKWQEHSKAAFEMFDVDKDGYISPEELRMYTGLKGSIETLLEEADIDKDGKISLAEFRRLLGSVSMNSSNVPSLCVRSSQIL
ncbi:Calcium-dependent protein kinase 28 [Apostasia shenzhenica]|uniref:Calcium-dependent protein kinase 28 n=1 Tax=Apostasia shenzhenica TaxID=1088818 RepID=A0A2I0AQZ6_9ASPA|nr:Calcium-dependent protein kinase 28 [Apostasia shenzhenica]